ncbi:MAG: cysteine hydrolase [Gammaproteobacteria bacterium]|nr:MAG: cysteine hydrolase [Gammaproteobacteria bacterium]RKZ91324.1 MAG: cysteine hydrolase [Gammaproteobacteria bacterium]RKZ99384.1 MAG: cysteine hydrolase [Gammaproteobacteria bacterium]
MSRTVLIIVDLQNDYFKGGKWELEGTEAAAVKAAMLLNTFRDKGLPVVHVRHEFPTIDAPFFAPNTEGAKAHSSVQEREDEPVVIKHQINSFRDTNLKDILDELAVDNILICGAMSHMCIDAVTRAANDFGYICSIAHDACATLELEFNGVTVPAIHVHAAFMAALGFAYANVASADELLAEISQKP